MTQWFRVSDERPPEGTNNLLALSVNGEVERTEYYDGSFWDKYGQEIDDGYYAYWTFGDFPNEHEQ